MAHERDAYRTSNGGGAPPRVWVLLGARKGDNRQLLALADALGWPYELFEVRYNALFSLPNLLLGPTRLTVRSCRPTPEPPWPDLVLAIGQRSVPFARWIKMKSGGWSKLVQLGRPRAPLDWFDLILTTPQYRLPERPNVQLLPLPVHDLTRAGLDAAAGAWRDRLSHLPRPRMAVIVGGPSWSYGFDTTSARRIARRADVIARQLGGGLMITTSPRTPPACADALEQGITVPHTLYRFDRERGADNPYNAFLGMADRILVTEESASCLAEVCAAGVPVTVLPLPKRPGLRLVERIAAGPAHRVFARLAVAGLATPPRDIGAIHAGLVDQGLAAWRDGLLEVRAPMDVDYNTRALAVRRVLALLGRSVRRDADSVGKPEVATSHALT